MGIGTVPSGITTTVPVRVPAAGIGKKAEEQKAAEEKKKREQQWAAQLAKWSDKGAEFGKQYREADGKRQKYQWLIADWMVDGKALIEGEGKAKKDKAVYDRAEKATKLNRATLRDWWYVAAHVPASLRNDKLSFYHHKAVAPLGTDEEKREWLEKAVAEKWSVADLNKKVNPPKPQPEGQRVLSLFQKTDKALCERLSTFAAQIGKTPDQLVQTIVREYLIKHTSSVVDTLKQSLVDHAPTKADAARA